jgi:hypothetical protein
MISIALTPVVPTAQGKFSGQLKSLVKSSSAHTLKAAFAFATAGGARTLTSALSTMPTWAQMKKHFIVGISQGITEPEAVRCLADLPNSQVRLFIPTKNLRQASLVCQPLFHPKLISLTSSDSFSLFVSSANLTGAAYGDPVRNFEFGLFSSLTGKDMPAAKAPFEAWWRHSWNDARKATPDLLERYASLRPPLFSRNPDLLQLIDPPPNITSATHLWFEAGLASGIERHQIEFPAYLAEFFGPIVRGRVNLTIRVGGKEWFPRPLTHKTTSFGVEIWRLGTPTVRSGGEAIQNRILRFSRTDEPLTFELAVTDVDTVTADDWEEQANLFGHLGQTRGANPRRYGLY